MNTIETIDYNSYVLTNFLCAFIHYINIPVCMYMYSYSNNEKYILDIIGVVTLSVSSHFYHYDIYSLLVKNKDENYIYPKKYNYIYFFNDQLSIHMRTILVLATNYYNTDYLYNVLSISILLHSVSIYNSIINMMDIVVDEKYRKENFFVITHGIIALPVMFDVFLVCLNTTTDIAIPFLFVNILLLFVSVIEPAYKYNQVLIHLLLLFQNYYVCLSNVST